MMEKKHLYIFLALAALLPVIYFLYKSRKNKSDNNVCYFAVASGQTANTNADKNQPVNTSPQTGEESENVSGRQIMPKKRSKPMHGQKVITVVNTNTENKVIIDGKH